MKTLSSNKRALVVFSSILFLLLVGCATIPKVEKLPPFQGFGGAKWGISIGEAKKAAETEGRTIYTDWTQRAPYAFYATGTYLNTPAIFSYYFTPKSKKLYRVDVTLKEVTVLKAVREDLVAKFGQPFHSKPNVDHWSWTDYSLVILQRDPDSVQIAYQGGELSALNHREENGLLQ